MVSYTVLLCMALNIGWTEAQSPQFAALGVVSQSQTSLVADLTFLNNGSSSVTASKPVSYPSPIAAACTTAYDYKNGVIFAAAGNSLMQIATNGSALKRVHLSDSQYFPTNLAVPAVGDERVLWSIGLDNSTDLITLAFIDSNTGNVFNQTPLILLQDITPCATEFSASGMFYYAYVFGNPFSGWDVLYGFNTTNTTQDAITTAMPTGAGVFSFRAWNPNGTAGNEAVLAIIGPGSGDPPLQLVSIDSISGNLTSLLTLPNNVGNPQIGALYLDYSNAVQAVAYFLAQSSDPDTGNIVDALVSVDITEPWSPVYLGVTLLNDTAVAPGGLWALFKL